MRCVLIATLLLAPAAALAEPTGAPVSAAQAALNTDKVICKKARRAASRLRTEDRKVCRTAAEWEAVAYQHRLATERMQRSGILPRQFDSPGGANLGARQGLPSPQ